MATSILLNRIPIIKPNRHDRGTPLETFFRKGNPSKLPVQNHGRVRRILLMLNAALTPEAMNIAGYYFYQLNTSPVRYSVRVTGNYRVTWAWDDGAVDVDMEDYH